MRGQGSDGSREVKDAVWIEVQVPQDELAVRALAAELGKGEASAIILAQELQAALLLIDEIRGRRVAQQLGLKVRGTLGILARARREGRIPSLRRMVDLSVAREVPGLTESCAKKCYSLPVSELLPGPVHLAILTSMGKTAKARRVISKDKRSTRWCAICEPANPQACSAGEKTWGDRARMGVEYWPSWPSRTWSALTTWKPAAGRLTILSFCLIMLLLPSNIYKKPSNGSPTMPRLIACWARSTVRRAIRSLTRRVKG